MSTNLIREIPDVSPKFAVDRSYGQLVTDFDIDFEAVTEYMRSRGLTDDQINASTVEFSAEKVDRIEGKYYIQRHGDFDREAKKININQPDIIFAYSVPYPPDPTKTAYISSDERVSTDFSDTITHEIEHYAQEGDDELKQQYDEVITNAREVLFNRGRKLGLKALSLIVGSTIGITVGTQVIKSQLESESTLGTPIEIGAFIANVAINSLSYIVLRRKLNDLGTEVRREVYNNSPFELAAREVTDQIKNKFVSVTAIRQPIDQFEKAIVNSLNILDGEVVIDIY